MSNVQLFRLSAGQAMWIEMQECNIHSHSHTQIRHSTLALDIDLQANNDVFVS
jgi:hypothetical protein